MEKSAVWGGECELKAISTVLKSPIQIYQASGPLRVIGEGYTDDPLMLSYHRHEFSLGEHYNAVRGL